MDDALGSLLSLSDLSKETQVNDDWLFSSLKRYKYSNMYESEKSLSAATWFTENNSSCELNNHQSRTRKLRTRPVIDHGESIKLAKFRLDYSPRSNVRETLSFHFRCPLNL